jgi:hypothetical protein
MNLRKTYLGLRKRYFNSTLPEKVAFRWTEKPRFGDKKVAIAMTLFFAAKRGRRTRIVIFFNSRLKGFDNILELYLLHEMVHVYLWYNEPYGKNLECGRRGRKFQKQMMRLARLDALADLW